MTGFEPWTSGVGSDRSANRAATPTRLNVIFLYAIRGRKPFVELNNEHPSN